MNRPNMSSARPLSRRVASIAAVVAFCAAGVAAAQPHPPYPQGPDALVQQIIQAVKGRLNLDTSQQRMWDDAVAATRSARQAARANLQRVHDALQAELAKPEPNLAAVAAISDEVQQQNRAQRMQLRDQWLSLYATFSPDQKAVVKDSINRRLARMDEFRARMRERLHAHGPNG